MALPDVVVNVTSAPTARTLPTDTGTAFFTGQTERGRVDGPTLLRSFADFGRWFGARLSTSTLSDAVEAYFAEGGTVLYVSRVFGAGAVAATRNLTDAGAAVSLVATAGQQGVTDPGTWGNSLSVGILTSLDDASIPAGQFRVQVLRSGVEVERSYLCTTQADAIGWSKGTPTTPGSNYVVLSLGASALAPQRQTAAALSGGTDGAAIADSDFQGALDRIPKGLGPGQIASPGQTTTARYLQLLDHAQQRNRFALLDGADTSSDTTLVTAAQGLYTAPNNGRRYGQLLAPWDVVPGLTATTTRTVPPCARQAAQYARTDALGNPNQAAAGARNGTARFAVDLSQPAWTDTQRLNLNNAGVTVSRRRFGNAIVTYGMRTLADQTLDAQWSVAPNVRCVMAFVARAVVVGDAHEFDQVDGFGQTLGAYRGELIAAANALFLVGALYGSTPAEAFYVDTGPGLNPPASLAAGIMTANVALRTSPSAEQVVVNVVKTPITQAL